MKTINCNQCNTPFKIVLEVDCINDESAYVCNNPECPNFALLQMALEDLPTPDEEATIETQETLNKTPYPQ